MTPREEIEERLRLARRRLEGHLAAQDWTNCIKREGVIEELETLYGIFLRKEGEDATQPKDLA